MVCKQRRNLKRHMQTHTKEKPFKCELCNHSTRDQSHLRRHLKTKKHQQNELQAQRNPGTTSPSCPQPSSIDINNNNPHGNDLTLSGFPFQPPPSYSPVSPPPSSPESSSPNIFGPAHQPPQIPPQNPAPTSPGCPQPSSPNIFGSPPYNSPTPPPLFPDLPFDDISPFPEMSIWPSPFQQHYSSQNHLEYKCLFCGHLFRKYNQFQAHEAECYNN